MSDEWIIVPNWHRFQHYGLARRPTWIKNYPVLLHKDEYTDLPLGARGLLHGIWLAYADRDGRLRRRDIASAIGTRTARATHTDSLLAAGLIEFSASKPLSLSLITTDAHAQERPERVVKRHKPSEPEPEPEPEPERDPEGANKAREMLDRLHGRIGERASSSQDG